MSDEKSGKHRWRDPVVPVSILAAVITAIPTYFYWIQPMLVPPTPELTPPTLESPPPTPVQGLSVATDKDE